MTTIERKMKLYEIVKNVLQKNDITQREKRLKADKILELVKKEAKDEFAELQIKDENFGAMLSGSISATEMSEIIRPESTQGYFLVPVTKEDKVAIEQAEKEQETKEETDRNKERVLYPVFEKWLLENGNRASDTSANRVMGKWGNPDITGIKIVTDYGLNEIEITTIEAKLSGVKWEYDIFEAVAHRRFANRVYFAFAVDIDSKTNFSRNKKLSYYAGLYEVGVLLLTMSKENYQKLLSGKIKTVDESDDSFDILELFPAKYHQINLEYKKEYLESIGVEKDQRMYRWGKDPIEFT